MNFKSILSLSALALFGVTNAAPINNHHHHQSEALKEAKNECHKLNGMLTIDYNESNYACLQRLYPEEEHKLIDPETSVCFYIGDMPFCVNSNYSNLEECDKSGDKFNYRACMINFIVGPIEIDERVRSYPEKKKILSSHEIDREECINNNGLLLVEDNSQYICLDYERYEPFDDGKHCVTVQKNESSDIQYYCVDEENSTIDVCNYSSSSYNTDECMNKIQELSKGRIAKVTKFW